MSRRLKVRLALATALCVAAGPSPPPNITASAPIQISPSGASFAPRVISCPSCSTGSGNVTGPASSVNGHLATFNGTTGQLIQDGGAVPAGYPFSTPVVGAGTTTSYAVGGTSNTVNSASGATNNAIGGGSSNGTGNAANQTIAGGMSNSTGANYATVGGGLSNNASGIEATISGGDGNSAGTTECSVAGGHGNTCSAAQGFTVGDTNSISGQAGVALGRENTQTAAFSSIAGGQFLTDRGTQGAFVEGGVGGPSGSTGGNAGRAQSVIYTLYSSTAGAVASRLTTNGAAAAAGNIGVLQTDMVAVWQCQIIISDKTSPLKVNTYTALNQVIAQNGSAATTVLGTSNPAVTVGPVVNGMTLQAAPTLTADTSLGGFNLSFTPPSGNTDTLYAVARCQSTETHFD